MKTDNLSLVMFQELNRLHQEGILKNKRIVLFGKNASSLGSYQYLNNLGYDGMQYIDNDKRKTDVCRPEELLLPFDDSTIILIASKYYPEMCHQLEAMGYVEGRHIIKTVDFYAIDRVIADWEQSSLIRLTQAQIRERQMKIVDCVDALCKKHGLRYSLCGGTLLGAVRHKGYIPWDDDIDIILPYPDYCRLFELIRQEPHMAPITIKTAETDFPMLFGRIELDDTITALWEYPFLYQLGVYIDVFPTWGLPGDENLRMQYFDEIRQIKTALLEDYVCHPIPSSAEREKREGLIRRAFQLIEEIPFDDAEYVAYAAGKNGIGEIVPKAIYDDYIELPFEDRTYKCMKGYDIYLRSLYGDYMQLPPEKERTTTHAYYAYFREGFDER